MLTFPSGKWSCFPTPGAVVHQSDLRRDRSSSLFSLIRVIFAVGYRRTRGIEHVSYTWLLGEGGSERALDRFGGSMMQRVEKWRIGRADVEYDHLGRLSRTGIVADHRHVRRLYHCLPGAHRERWPVFEVEREGAFNDIDGHGKAMAVVDSFVARFECCRQDAHGLLAVIRQSFNYLLQNQPGFGQSRFLRMRRNAED